jgi:hypothetical protein
MRGELDKRTALACRLRRLHRPEIEISGLTTGVLTNNQQWLLRASHNGVGAIQGNAPQLSTLSTVCLGTFSNNVQDTLENNARPVGASLECYPTANVARR